VPVVTRRPGPACTCHPPPRGLQWFSDLEGWGPGHLLGYGGADRLRSKYVIALWSDLHWVGSRCPSVLNHRFERTDRLVSAVRCAAFRVLRLDEDRTAGHHTCWAGCVLWQPAAPRDPVGRQPLHRAEPRQDDCT
jgi:hypothetical protein